MTSPDRPTGPSSGGPCRVPTDFVWHAGSMELLVFVLVGITLLLVVGLVSFYLGVRYSRRLMPTALARLDEEDLNALAEKTAQERARLQR